MKKYNHLKEKAVSLRLKGQSLIDICDKLKLNKSTVWSWIKDLPKKITRNNKSQKLATQAMKNKYKTLRDNAYSEGASSASHLMSEPKFRDFIVLYLAEGYKRCRNVASICNSDISVMKLCKKYFLIHTCKKLNYRLQYHVDQNFDDLKLFWGINLKINPDEIVFQRKSNSGKLAKRQWRSQYGVLTIAANDTYLRAKIQAWMDFLKDSWNSCETPSESNSL